mgnify:CR=1 FL=1
MTNAARGDIGALVDLKPAIRPQNYADDTADLDGTGVDTAPQGQEYNGATFHVQTNNGNASDDFTFTVQESSDDGSSDTYADLTDADGNAITGQITGVDGSIEINVLGNIPHEKHLKLKLKNADATIGGTSTDISATATLGGKKFQS